MFSIAVQSLQTPTAYSHKNKNEIEIKFITRCSNNVQNQKSNKKIKYFFNALNTHTLVYSKVFNSAQ